MKVPVSIITNNAIDLADMRNSSFIDQSGLPGSELLRYANLAYKDAYQQIKSAKEHYFTQAYPMTLNGGLDFKYPLPPDFYTLNGVDYQYQPNLITLTITPIMFIERNQYRYNLAILPVPWGTSFHYLIYNETIEFLPAPPVGTGVTLWYTPEPAVITSLDQILSLPPGTDEYMALYMACAMKAKEESDTTTLDSKRIQTLEQLKHSLRERDTGSAPKVADRYRINNLWFPWGPGGSGGAY